MIEPRPFTTATPMRMTPHAFVHSPDPDKSGCVKCGWTRWTWPHARHEVATKFRYGLEKLT